MGSNHPTAVRQFIVNSLRAFYAAETPPSVTPVAEPVMWEALIELAAFHRVAPLLDRALRDHCPPELPAAVRAELAAYARSLANRSLLLTGELVRVLKDLDMHGISALPFKGPALACLLYGDPALRHFDDLDILVRPSNYQAAQQCLLARGYQLQERRAFHTSLMLARGNCEIVVELHEDIMPALFPFRTDRQGIWERCGTFALGGLPMRTLAPEDLLLFLCVHGSRHLWLRLQWICDIAQLLRRAPSLDWELTLTQARRAGGQRMLLLGVVLAHDLLGAPLPPEIVQQARRDPRTMALARQVHWRLFEGPLQRFKPWKDVQFRAQLIDRVRDRLLYAASIWLKLLLTPTADDWNCLPLPRALFPLYYVLHPFRVVGKYGLRIARGFYKQQ